MHQGCVNKDRVADTLRCVQADPQCLSQDGPNQADHSTWPVVAGYLIYGFFVGPILGYIFDFHNRVTVSKERGSAILILGLNLGSSLVPAPFLQTAPDRVSRGTGIYHTIDQRS